MDRPGVPERGPRAAFVGTPRQATAALETMRLSGAELVGVVAHPEPSGRAPGLALLHSRARAMGVPVLSPRGATVPAALQWLAHLALDYVVCAGWSGMLTEDLFRIPRHGVVGLAPVVHSGTRLVLVPDWAVLRAGTSAEHVLLVLLPVATAPTSWPAAPLHRGDADGSVVPDVYEALARTGARLLETERADAAIGGATSAGGRSTDVESPPPPLGLTSFDRTAAEVHAWVQAMGRCGTGAFASLRGELVVIWDCEPAWGDERRLPPGTVLGADTGVVVSCRGGGLRLFWVQVPGGSVEPASEWFARTSWPPGCAFDPVDWSALSWLRH